VSRNKIFPCAYFSIHFRIKFLLFNDFLSYILLIFENNRNISPVNRDLSLKDSYMAVVLAHIKCQGSVTVNRDKSFNPQ